MSALATLFNPIEKGDDQILIFFNNSSSQLAFQQTTVNGSQDVETLTEPVQSKGQGAIKNPSQIAAIRYDNLVRVYAVQQGTKDEKAEGKNDLVLLSPGYLPLRLATELTYGSLAACSNGTDRAWLYYPKGNPTTIIQYDLKSKDRKTISVNGISPGSYLAACFDRTSQTPYFFCQSNAKAPTILRCDGNAVESIQNTSNAAANTPIAVCAHPDKSQIQIYYTTNTDKQVHRVAWIPGKYGDPTTVTGPSMDDYTTISVTAAKDGVHVFYLFQPDDERRIVAHVKDKWAEVSN